MYKLNTSSYSPSLSPLLPSLGQFEKGVAEGAVDSSFNPVVALRLSVIKDSAVWAILSEVSQSHAIICPLIFYVMFIFYPAECYPV